MEVWGLYAVSSWKGEKREKRERARDAETRKEGRKTLEGRKEGRKEGRETEEQKEEEESLAHFTLWHQEDIHKQQRHDWPMARSFSATVAVRGTRL